MPTTKQNRKTRDCWRFYLNYGQGWEHEITEYTREAMQVNRKAYRENASQYPLRVVKGREWIACRNCGIDTGNVGEVKDNLCNLCAVAGGAK